MKYLALLFLFAAGSATAQERIPEGVELCREEEGDDFTARYICYENWEKSLHFFLRYSKFSGAMDEDGEYVMPNLKELFLANPFKPNRRRLLDNCSAGQLYNGNMFSGSMDYREIWACIVKNDPVAARWDTI